MNDARPAPALHSSKEVLAIVERIKPHLAGLPPETQGAVLAELLSLWLAGHYQAGNRAILELLKMHTDTALALTPINIEYVKTRVGAPSNDR